MYSFVIIVTVTVLLREALQTFSLSVEPSHYNNLTQLIINKTQHSNETQNSNKSKYSNETHDTNETIFGVRKDNYDKISEEIDQLENSGYLFFPHIYRAFISAGRSPARYKLSSTCGQNMAAYYHGLTTRRGWAWNMYDSTGKQGAGVFTGALTWTGNYLQCVDALGYYKNLQEFTSGDEIPAQFCSVYIATPPWVPELVKSFKLQFPVRHPPFVADICVVKGCSEQDLHNIVQMFVNQVTWQANYTVTAVKCKVDTHLRRDIAALVTLAVLAVILLLVPVGTLFEVWLRARRQGIKTSRDITIGEQSHVASLYRKAKLHSIRDQVRPSLDTSDQNIPDTDAGNKKLSKFDSANQNIPDVKSKYQNEANVDSNGRNNLNLVTTSQNEPTLTRYSYINNAYSSDESADVRSDLSGEQATSEQLSEYATCPTDNQPAEVSNQWDASSHVDDITELEHRVQSASEPSKGDVICGPLKGNIITSIETENGCLPDPSVNDGPSPVVNDGHAPVVNDSPTPVVNDGHAPVVNDGHAPEVNDGQTHGVNNGLTHVHDNGPLDRNESVHTRRVKTLSKLRGSSKRQTGSISLPRMQKKHLETKLSMNDRQEKSLPNTVLLLERMLVCFSLRRNLTNVLGKGHADTMFCLNGVRVMSIGWIVMGSYYGALYSNPTVLENHVDTVKLTQSFWTQAMINTTLAADTFFLLSGTLYAYNFMKVKAKNKTKQMTRVMTLGEYMWMVGHRLARIVPCYYLIIMVYTNLGPYMVQAVEQHPGLKSGSNCHKHWWTNALFISNFYQSDKMCMPWTYYLVNDFQLSLLSPLVVIPLLCYPVLGYILVALLVAVQILSVMVINSGINGSVLRMADTNYFSQVYVKPYCRVAPYAIGLGLGYLLYTGNKKVSIRKVPLYLGWTAALGIVVATPYITYSENQQWGAQWTGVERSLYEALTRPAWALAVAWVIFTCCNGQGGFISKILSWNFFLPLCRITYGVFLLHPVVIEVIVASRRSNVFITLIELIYGYISVLVSCWCLALVLIAVVEQPFVGVEALVRACFQNKKYARS